MILDKHNTENKEERLKKKSDTSPYVQHPKQNIDKGNINMYLHVKSKG